MQVFNKFHLFWKFPRIVMELQQVKISEEKQKKKKKKSSKKSSIL